MQPLDLPRLLRRWPLIRQLTDGDPLALGRAVRSSRTEALHPRTQDADRVVPSICPYCAVGCAQRVHVKDGEILHIDGDPDSPISRGRLCPKGSATRSLVTHDRREHRVKYRRPFGTGWEDLPLDRAMDMIADRIIATRAATWDDREGEGDDERIHNRTLGIASLGGATLDIEENYLIKKLLTALGVVQVENQARI
jgi:formate dehydrogenase major subunit